MLTLCAFSSLVQFSKILQTGVCASQSSCTLSMCSTARIQGDVSAASFCGCKLLWRNDECVLLPCSNVQPDIFAVVNSCITALSIFSSDVLTWSADSLYSVQWRIK